ncbi:hypothetical protein NMY22_g7594 [Coprinellus aureogranulatus]|nr:hypothetical protein NMY22_g7594 [Coprinellus aureogranulatus]
MSSSAPRSRSRSAQPPESVRENVVTALENDQEDATDGDDSDYDSIFDEDAEDEDAEEQVEEVPIALDVAPPIPGLYFDPTIRIPEDLADSVVQFCEATYFTSPNANQVMLFGHPPGIEQSADAKSNLPGVLLALLENLASSLRPILPDPTFDLLFPSTPKQARQAIINLYRPGEGITPHVDLLGRYADGIIGVSFGSGCVMRFDQAEVPESEERPRWDLYLPERSVLVLSEEARYGWTHGIDKRTQDYFSGVYHCDLPAPVAAILAPIRAEFDLLSAFDEAPKLDLQPRRPDLQHTTNCSQHTLLNHQMADTRPSNGGVDKPSRFNVSKLLFLGLLFHVIFIGSVFDCYFTSPVVSGMKRFNVGTAPAKRLVLIVGDGLRADLLYNLNPFPNVPNSPKIVAPYLRSIVEERGAFGISHTRVPTESRPGHVAIIGGMYEDVSAVTKGWKVNPVDFDSVFNQSSSTYSFGSPDILPMFARGATPGKVKEWSYHEDDEDFTKDATALDLWVLDHLEQLLRNATSDPKLDTDLRQDKVVIFLHLLGLDTTGHSYRPHSKEYMRNIQVVDDVVRRTEKLVSDFFQDQETSFIFTADHDPDNTRTPLIAWGKGVRGPLPEIPSGSHDTYSEPWGLGHLYRRDVEQADIASLMAALIGLDWPVNSVGVLPDADPYRPGYLDPSVGEETIAKAALVNAKVILEQYRIKHELKKQHTLLYKPFGLLHSSEADDEAPGSTQIRALEQHMENGMWAAAKQDALNLIHTGLKGLHYLQTYDRFLIRTIVTLAYTGWAAFASMYIFRPEEASSNAYRSTISGVAGTLLLASWAAFAVQKSPWSFYIYVAFPVYFWQQFLAHGAPDLVSRFAREGSLRLVMWTLFAVASTQAMVVGYTHRSVWSGGFLIMGLLWPFTWAHKQEGSWKLTVSWVVLCLANAVFPLLSVNKTESVVTM